LIVRDENGNPLFSWMVELMTAEENFSKLHLNEPWNSPANTPLLGETPEVFHCIPYERKCSWTSYVAVSGPGTFWREDRAITPSELPDGGSHTVVLVETADISLHWAKPYSISVEELLENTKNGKGLRISTNHHGRTHALFADGSMRFLPAKMPISLWEKLLAGELTVDQLENIDTMFDSESDSPDMLDTRQPLEINLGNEYIFYLSILVWLLSISLLFRRAVKSRKKHEDSTAITQQPAKTV
jgi:hypothetical protein